MNKRTGLALMLTFWVMSAACSAASTVAVTTPTSTPQDEPECVWEGAFPADEAQMIWHTLLPVEIESASPGDDLEIMASGGYLQWDNECGEAIDESARAFQLLFDGEPAGNLSCYVNVCRIGFTIPVDASSGMHRLSVEGGSSLDIEVVVK